jgi:hypothetical protein
MSDRESTPKCIGSEGDPARWSVADPGTLLGPGEGKCPGCGQPFKLDSNRLIPWHPRRFGNE